MPLSTSLVLIMDLHDKPYFQLQPDARPTRITQGSSHLVLHDQTEMSYFSVAIEYRLRQENLLFERQDTSTQGHKAHNT